MDETGQDQVWRGCETKAWGVKVYIPFMSFIIVAFQQLIHFSGASLYWYFQCNK